MMVLKYSYIYSSSGDNMRAGTTRETRSFKLDLQEITGRSVQLQQQVEKKHSKSDTWWRPEARKTH